MLRVVVFIVLAANVINAALPPPDKYLVSPKRKNQAEGKLFCQSQNYQIANIANESTFIEIRNWILTTQQRYRAVSFWTGLTVSPNKGREQFPILTDGRQGKFNLWTTSARLPSEDPSRKFLMVTISNMATESGLWNSKPEIKRRVICEKKDDVDPVCHPNPCGDDGRCVPEGNSYICECSDGSREKFCCPSESKPEDKEKRIRKAFAEFDHHKKATIVVTDLDEVLNSLGKSPTSQQITEMLKELDPDGDFNIEYVKFLKFMLKGTDSDIPDADTDLEKAFAAQDTDDDGVILTTQLGLVLQDLDFRFNIHQLVDLIEIIDPDETGRIERERFLPIIGDLMDVGNVLCGVVNCGEHGTCKGGSCTCKDGYSGKECQTPPPDPCANVNCGQHGSCMNGVCTCTDGYTGDYCNVAPDPCADVVCGEHAICNGGSCTCKSGYSGDNCAILEGTTCKDVSGSANGVATLVSPKDGKLYQAFCDGDWTVFQRRVDGSQDFYLGWSEYVDGFGNANSEFWLGLDILHELTKNNDMMLRVDLEDKEGNTAYAEYTTFSVGPASDKYRLNVGGYSGTAGDSLTYNNGMQFTTKDADNDVDRSGNCATLHTGAWWYHVCGVSLNVQYAARGVIWYHWSSTTLSKVSMKIRKK